MPMIFEGVQQLRRAYIKTGRDTCYWVHEYGLAGPVWSGIDRRYCTCTVRQSYVRIRARLGGSAKRHMGSWAVPTNVTAQCAAHFHALVSCWSGRHRSMNLASVHLRCSNAASCREHGMYLLHMTGATVAVPAIHIIAASDRWFVFRNGPLDSNWIGAPSKLKLFDRECSVYLSHPAHQKTCYAMMITSTKFPIQRSAFLEGLGYLSGLINQSLISEASALLRLDESQTHRNLSSCELSKASRTLRLRCHKSVIDSGFLNLLDACLCITARSISFY